MRKLIPCTWQLISSKGLTTLPVALIFASESDGFGCHWMSVAYIYIHVLFGASIVLYALSPTDLVRQIYVVASIPRTL